MPLFSKDNKNLYFIHIPKTGGSSIYKNLQQNNVSIDYLVQGKKVDKYNVKTPQHFHYEKLQSLVPEFKNLKKFAILRDPWDRTISEFVWRTKTKDFQNLDSWLYKTLKEYNDDRFIYDNHFLPQSFFISDDVKLFDHNNYTDALNYLSNYFNVSIDKNIKEKKYNYNKIDIDILSKQTKELWNNIYSKDIDLYRRKNDN